MTQVLSVSASTAAYAMEGAKPAQRVSRKSDVELAIHELARKVEQSDDFRLKALMTVVKPPALALFFLTSSSYQNPQATYSQVDEAYKETDKATR